MDISKSRVLTVDDYLPLTELSLDRAVSVLPENLRTNFETAWRWFISMSGTTGTRMLGKRIPGVTDDFPISAQRGIHVPSRSGIALSVTVARGSIYSATDQPFIELPNGTWILEYSAHRNNTGGETDTRWNDGLLRCLKLGLPVGVFIGHFVVATGQMVTVVPIFRNQKSLDVALCVASFCWLRLFEHYL